MLFLLSCFFFNDTATTEIYTVSYTLSLHDALPICWLVEQQPALAMLDHGATDELRSEEHTSELQSPDTTSYAVFCLKKKTNKKDYIEFLLMLKIKNNKNNIDNK